MTRARDLADYIAQGVSTTELDILDGLTTTTAELNILDGATTTTAELNYNDTGAAVGTVVASKTVTVDANKDASSFRNITMAGDLSIGGDVITVSNADLDLAPHGTGTVVVRGNTNSAAIVFNCESNSHGQKVFGQPHSAGVTNTLMLPAGANSTLLSRVSVDTLTNKTLTSPKINEDVAVTSTATELNILDGVTSTTAELNILDGVTSTAAELNILDGVTSTAAELNILDGVTSTAAEINLIDGDTARGTTAVASGDGILINDAGTMRMTNVDTVSTYFAGHSVGGANVVTTGALNSGSITSGFGTINIGSSAFTTTGAVNFGSLADGTITVTAFADEDDMSSDSATLVPTQQSVKKYVDDSVATAASKGFAIAAAIVFG